MNLSNAAIAKKAMTFIAIALFLAVSALSAATVSGVITDSRTGDYLPGANVMLEGTNFGSATDRSGEFRITGVPEGEYVLVANYIGYDKTSQAITVTFDSDLNRVDFELTASYIGLDEVIVSVLRTGEAKALSQQKSSDKIQNVISTEQIEKFPDPNAAEALSRLPGVSVQKDHGEGRYILIRGSAARLNSTQINGNTLPSPEDDNRNVSLDVIPSDLLAGIEVSKALTPDMDGDAIGGSVNLISKTAFDFDKRVSKADFTGGYKALRGGVGEKATFTFADIYMDGKLGVLIGGSYNNDNRATDNIEMEWGDAYETVTNIVDEFEVDDDDITDTTWIYEVDEIEDVKVLNDMQMNYYDVRRQRVGMSANFDYKLNKNSTFSIKFLNNNFKDFEDKQRYRLRFDKSVDEEEPGTGWTDENTIVGARIERELKHRTSESIIQSVAFGGEHHFDALDLDYNLSHATASETRTPSRNIVFTGKGIDFTTDVSDYTYPTFSVDNGFDLNDASEYEFDEMEYKDGESTEDKDLTASLNIKMPYTFGNVVGSLKLGGKYKDKNKNSDKTNELIYEWDGDDDLTLEGMTNELDGSEFMDGNYDHQMGIDPDKFNEFWEDNGDFESEPGLEANFYETWDANEVITAGYGMTTLKMGKISVVAGARLEMTSTTYNGWKGDLALVEDGDAEMEKVSDSYDYSNFLPMVHLRYDLNDKMVIRTAFTQTMSRPDYITLVPYQKFDDGELEIGNPGLIPTTATNLDLMVEYYIGKLGILSAGVYSKTLADYIYNRVVEPEDMLFGDEEVEEILEPVNGADATISGFEVQWSQQLTFLPGILSGLGIYTNYTHTTSEAQYFDRDPTTMPGQADNVGNVAVSFEAGGFTARASMNFHGMYLEEVGGDEDEDIYYADNTQTDLSFTYDLNSGIMLYADIVNLNNSPMIYYQGGEDFPIQREIYSQGFRMGAKFNF